MAYKNFTNCTEEQYYEIIYSQDDTNRIKILFNNVELADADEYCEKLTVKNRILPDDGSKRFSLGNFVSKEAELILRDLPSTTVIQDQVSISIGTLVNESNDTYEYVPIGIFNIQDTPVTDQNKVTIKLRDNRVKFDYYYNAKPLIDEKGGKANYYQILDDICTQAGVINKVGHFAGDDIEVSIYDNTITATSYVAKIAEQCGMIPVINRLGELEFINPKSDKATTQIESTATLQNVGSTQIDNIELIGNTTQASTPTPSSPQEVKTVTGRQEIKTVGKNLFNLGIGTETIYGIEVIKNNSKVVFNNSTNSNGYKINTSLGLFKAGTYTFSFNRVGTINAGAGEEFALRGTTNLLTTSLNRDNYSYTFTLTNDTELIARYWVNSGCSYTNYIVQFQIEKGNTATTYEPYQEQVNEINLGKNLFNTTETTTTLIKDTTRTINITPTGGNITLPAGTYTISFPDLVLQNNNYNMSVQLVGVESSGQTLTNKSKTITINETKTLQYLYIYLNSNDNANATATFSKIMLEKGTQATSYSPYFTPIELCKIGTYEDKIFKTTGKNLFDKDDNTMILNSVYVNTSTGKIQSASNSTCVYIKCKSNTTYTISKTAGTRFVVGSTNETPTLNLILNKYTSNANASYITFKTGANDTYLVAWIWSGGTDTTITSSQMLASVQIEKGTQATPYEPYSNNEWYVKKNIGKVVLNGSENWASYTGYTGTGYCYYVSNNDFALGRETSICSHFKNVYGAYVAGTGYIGAYSDHTSVNRKYFVSAETTLANFKTWLGTNKPLLYYIKITPTYEKLNDTLQDELNSIRLLEGLNNIISSVPIELEYYVEKTPIRIPLSIIEKYEVGEPYTIERVVYESGVIKYETSDDDTLSTLYLDASNEYIESQEQVDYIKDMLNGFTVDSVNTGRVLGNPAIDAYDLIEVYDDDDDNEPTIFKTFANNTYTYTGINRNTFDTQIGIEERTENVSISGEANFQKWAKTSINNLKGSIELNAGEVDDLDKRLKETKVIVDSDSATLTFIEENTLNEDGSVKALSTPNAENTTTYTFDKNGIKIGKSTDDYNSLQDNTGTYYYEKDTMIGKYTKDGSVQKDLALFGTYYYGIDEENFNVADFKRDDALFVAQLYVDNNNETGFGHFFNR